MGPAVVCAKCEAKFGAQFGFSLQRHERDCRPRSRFVLVDFSWKWLIVRRIVHLWFVVGSLERRK